MAISQKAIAVSAIRAAVRSIDPGLAISDIHVMSDLASHATAPRRFQTTLLIHRIHSIGILYEHWKFLINPRLNELKDMSKHKPDWTIVDGADEWVKVIDSVDPRSTYSRYPSIRDAEEDQSKSPFKAATAEELFPENSPEDRKIMALVIENADGEFVRAYMNEKGSEPDKEYMAALEAMRFELTSGF